VRQGWLNFAMGFLSQGGGITPPNTKEEKMAYQIKNWQNFQHYKDRKPLWIKLYRDVLDSIDFAALSGMAAKNLIMIWLIGSEYDGDLPDIDTLAFRLRVKVADLEKSMIELCKYGFLIETEKDPRAEKTTSKEIREKAGFGDRYVDQVTKNLIMLRDVDCVFCGSSENLEIDHIVPVSKGGDSEPENLQVLCRSCNRSKRTKSVEQVATPLAQVATQKKVQRSLEIEIEKEIEKEVEIELEKEVCSELVPSTKPNTQDFYQPQIIFPTKGTPAEWVLPMGLFHEIQHTFKNDPVLDWIKQARLWTIANPIKQKTARGMPAFLIGWVTRQNDRPAQPRNFQTNGKAKPDLQAALSAMPRGFQLPQRVQP